MKIIFDNWHDARTALDEVRIEPSPQLFLKQEGSVRTIPYAGSNYPHTWTAGTGRWYISDCETPDRTAMIHNQANYAAWSEGKRD